VEAGGSFEVGADGGISGAGDGFLRNCMRSPKDRSGSLPCCIASEIGFSGTGLEIFTGRCDLESE